MHVGVWRSWLARTPGGREVVGSSPATPTIEVACQRPNKPKGKTLFPEKSVRAHTFDGKKLKAF